MTDLPSTDYTPVHADEEISLLDLLATITENLRLLVVGPLVMGLTALSITFVVTPTFDSRSVLRLGESAIGLLSSDDLLTPLLPLAPWIDSKAPRTVQLSELRDTIKPTFNKKDVTLVLSVSGPSAEQAQKLHLATIDELRRQLLPKGRLLEQTEQRRVTAQATLDELNAVIPSLSQNVVRPSADSESSLRAYSLLLQQRLSAQQSLQEIENSLKPFGEEVFVQLPSLPDKSVKSQKARIAFVATLVTGFMLLVFVFIRQAMRNAANNPQDAQRLKAIKTNIAKSLGKRS